MFKKLLVASLFSSLSLSALAGTPEGDLMKSKTLKGLKRGIQAEHGMKCGKVEDIKFFVDESNGYPQSKFSAAIRCSALELNEDGDRNALIVEVSGVAGDGGHQIQSINISWAG